MDNVYSKVVWSARTVSDDALRTLNAHCDKDTLYEVIAALVATIFLLGLFVILSEPKT